MKQQLSPSAQHIAMAKALPHQVLTKVAVCFQSLSRRSTFAIERPLLAGPGLPLYSSRSTQRSYFDTVASAVAMVSVRALAAFLRVFQQGVGCPVLRGGIVRAHDNALAFRFVALDALAQWVEIHTQPGFDYH